MVSANPQRWHTRNSGTGRRLVGSLAGAAHLVNPNPGDHGWLTEDRNLQQILKVKASLTGALTQCIGRESVASRSYCFYEPFSNRCQKSYHRDNWLVAAKRSQRRGFLILRCRLFLSFTRSRGHAQDCSSTNRERELGLDRRETGQFYPTDKFICATVIHSSTRGTNWSFPWVIQLIEVSVPRIYHMLYDKLCERL